MYPEGVEWCLRELHFFFVVFRFKFFSLYVGPGDLKISSIPSLQNNLYWKSPGLSQRGTIGAGAIQFSIEQGGGWELGVRIFPLQLFAHNSFHLVVKKEFPKTIHNLVHNPTLKGSNALDRTNVPVPSLDLRLIFRPSSPSELRFHTLLCVPAIALPNKT